MLRSTERKTFFILFCSFTVACVLIEVFLCYSMIVRGFTAGKAVTGVLNGTIMFAAGKIFLKVVSKTFLEPDDVLSFTKLHRFASDRCRILEEDTRAGLDVYATRQHLVTEILSFAEESLREWLPGTHFELCIFVDADQPLLFAYFDSNRQGAARSMQLREKNPYWYVENNYEVTKLLKEPTSHPKIIQNTADKRIGYFFASDQQRKQVKSTMLWCIDLKTPCAIVISSNARSAFRESDPESFIKFVGNMARFDLFERDFLPRIRELRPDLFPGAMV
jgi:hypothetical protein